MHLVGKFGHTKKENNKHFKYLPRTFYYIPDAAGCFKKLLLFRFCQIIIYQSVKSLIKILLPKSQNVSLAPRSQINRNWCLSFVNFPLLVGTHFTNVFTHFRLDDTIFVEYAVWVDRAPPTMLSTTFWYNHC